MNVAIIGGSEQNLQQLDDTLMKLIEDSGHYLFNVISGYIGDPTTISPPLGQIWAKYRGLPYHPKQYKDLDSLMSGVTASADYAIFLNDGSQIMKRFIMTYRMSGKHGSVINI